MFAIEADYPLFTDVRSGLPLTGGSVYIGQAGQNPETHPVTVYWDADGTQPAAQPIKTVNGYPARAGTPAVLYITGDFSITVRDAAGAFMRTALNSSRLATALQGPNGGSFIGWEQDGVDPALRDLLMKLRDAPVTPADFEAVGDGVADDTTAIKNMLAATVATRIARLERGKTYKIASDELVMQDYSRLELNGAMLRFTVTGNLRNLAVGNGCVVDGGGGRLDNTAGNSGLNGQYATPITVGLNTAITGCSGWEIRNLTISSNTVDGNGIAIIGDSHNGVVDNIYFPTSSTMAIGVLAHWGSAGGVAGPTGHPNNIRISNISAGTLSNNTASWRALVFLSASYNIEVNNIYTTEVVHGTAVTVYCGDFGFQYGSTIEQIMGMCGISIRNVYGQYRMGCHIYGTNPSGAVTDVWPGDITIDKMCVYGITGDTSSEGLRVEAFGDANGTTGRTGQVLVRGSTFDSFYFNTYLGGIAKNLTMENCSLRTSVSHGFNAVDTLAGSGNIALRNVKFLASNTSGGAGHPDVYGANIAGLTVRECSFDSSNASWSVRVDNTCSRVRVVENHVYNVSAAGPAFSYGAATDKGIVIEDRDNTCDDSPANGVRGGQVYVPAYSSFRYGAGNVRQRVYFAAGPPSAGQLDAQVGDLIVNHAPTGGAVPLWECTGAGDPGTWKALSANLVP